MKPIQLKMTAFGPYKDTEVIDFRELEENNLFVISGNTGSGKTTIFDGISFALYGTASGQDRENTMMLRSDFAADDTHTAVELEFELKGKRYRILRRLGHVKEGNKSKTGEHYEFYEKVDGREKPCVDRQIVSEINMKVEELIGLTQDQFKQIVMLPQGEFRKLLTSETSNKEAILRRLFKTESYQLISERLGDRRSQIDKEHKQAELVCKNYIEHIHAVLPERTDSSLFQLLAEEHYNINQILTNLADEEIFYKEKVKVDESQYKISYNKHHEMQETYHKAKAINDRFAELESKKELLKQLEDQTALFKEKESRLLRSNQASQIEPYEKQVEEWTKTEDKQLLVFRQSNQQVEEVEQEYKKVVAVYKEEEGKEKEREAIKREVDRLEDYRPVVKEIDIQGQYVAKIKKQVRESYTQLQEIKEKQTEKKKHLGIKQEKIKKMDEQVSARLAKKEQLLEMRDQVRVLMEYQNIAEQQEEVKKALTKKEAIYMEQKKEFEIAEQTWLQHQASLLAAHLHDGEACPVCGSHSHPAKATTEKEGLTREKLAVLKKERDKKETAYRTLLATYESNKKQLKIKAVDVRDYQIKIEDVGIELAKITEAGKKLKEEVKTLDETNQKLAEEKEKVEKKEKEIEEVAKKLEIIEGEYQKIKSTYETTSAVFNEKIKSIPEEVRALDQLEKKITEMKKQQYRLDESWKEAQENIQKVKDKQTNMIADLRNARKRLEEVKDKKEEVKEVFHQALKRANFSSEKVYSEAKMSASKQETLKQEIEIYNQRRSMLQQQTNELKVVLKDKEKVDVIAYEKQLEQLKGIYEQALQTLNRTKDYVQEIKKLSDSIHSSHKKVMETEHKLRMITDLYDVARGHNTSKISFERYLQIEYLEQIIEAANYRLQKLSNGQFRLQRSERKESHGRQSGLALDVYDEFTGQIRDVKTFSGGEKFNASLCLALGMSDVIQSFQGNISIDTMFIDEGFGSLDEESLNKSIDILIELQESGRMIGVISHVQELKEIFPAVLQVTKTQEGYSNTSFTVR